MIKELEGMGFDVDYICDAPSNSNISKAIGRINKNLIKYSTQQYFERTVLPKITGVEYNKVLVVGGMTFAFTPDMILKIKELNPKASFLLYQWDSEQNLPYSTGIHIFFDKVFSFDMNDCERDNMYTFLPLFYTRIYEEIGSESVESYKYDCSYVGTAHPQKFKDINTMSGFLADKMKSQFIYHYMPSKLKYIYHKILAPEFKNASLSDFSFEKIASNEMMKIFKESKCILDAPQAGQTGLTIRTIECLGAKRKLITTNKDIMKYDFYDENNILVFDNGLDLKAPFFNNEYKDVDEDIYRKYSLREWLKFMLN